MRRVGTWRCSEDPKGLLALHLLADSQLQPELLVGCLMVKDTIAVKPYAVRSLDRMSSSKMYMLQSEGPSGV